MGFRLFSKGKSSDDSTPSSAEVFAKNLPKNVALAASSVPCEAMALRRITYKLDNPYTKPPSYMAVHQAIGNQGLFAGSLSRIIYCLTGNFATVTGIGYFGSNSEGILKTTVVKNAILPLFLASNARQLNLDPSQTFRFMAKSIKDPVVHLSFFARNLLGNSCLLPGFMVRDYSFQMMNESNTTIPTFLGFGTSVAASTMMNAILKPLFTGSYTFKTRCMAAASLPAKFPLMLRELASLGLVFGNTSPKKKMDDDSSEPPKFKV